MNKKKKKKKRYSKKIDISTLDCETIIRNIEWMPQSEVEYPYMPPVESICNTNRHCGEDEYVDEYKTPEKKEAEGFEDWEQVYDEHIHVRLNKPPQGEAKDKTPGAKAKPNPWDMPDKGFGDVYDRRHGVWVGGRDKFDHPIVDGRSKEWFSYHSTKDEDSIKDDNEINRI